MHWKPSHVKHGGQTGSRQQLTLQPRLWLQEQLLQKPLAHTQPHMPGWAAPRSLGHTEFTHAGLSLPQPVASWDHPNQPPTSLHRTFPPYRKNNLNTTEEQQVPRQLG